MRGVRWFGMVALVAVLMGFMGVPQAAQAQSFNVEPNVAPPGSSFDFFADGFNSVEQVGVWVNNPDGTVSDIVDVDGDVVLVFSNSDGRADWSVFIDTGSPTGFYQMVALGVDSGVQVVIPFEVRAGAPAPVNFNVEPNAGPSGTDFAFFADGFDPIERVGVWTNNPDGTVSEIVDANGNTFVLIANDDGRVDWFVTVVDVPGRYEMVVYGTESGRQVVIPFEITP